MRDAILLALELVLFFAVYNDRFAPGRDICHTGQMNLLLEQQDVIAPEVV